MSMGPQGARANRQAELGPSYCEFWLGFLPVEGHSPLYRVGSTRNYVYTFCLCWGSCLASQRLRGPWHLTEHWHRMCHHNTPADGRHAIRDLLMIETRSSWPYLGATGVWGAGGWEVKNWSIIGVPSPIGLWVPTAESRGWAVGVVGGWWGWGWGVHYTWQVLQMGFRCKFVDHVYNGRSAAWFVSEIRWRLRILDAEPSSNFEHKLHNSWGRLFASAKMRPTENSIEELTKCNRSSALPLLGYGYFTIWPLKYQVKIIAQGHIVGSTSYRLSSLSFWICLWICLLIARLLADITAMKCVRTMDGSLGPAGF